MSALFAWPVRVYYEDTDAGGIVFYANYLRFMERARTEWLRAAGVHQHTLKEQAGLLFVVKSVTVDYQAAAVLDDQLQVTVEVQKIGKASILLAQQVIRGEQVLVTSAVKIGCVGASDLRPAAIPAGVLQAMQQNNE